ncbi:MAG: D-alanine aminotransferase [Chlamydiae bacterium]|nr:D-alanine aminotransferase [Chlamydiota bacterium]
MIDRIFHFVDGEFCEDPKISALDLGVLRGYGVFDYAQVHEGRPFHLMDHLKRLAWSARQVGLKVPVGLEELEEITLALLEKNPPIDAGIRFVVTGGVSHKDQLLPIQSASLMIFFHPFSPIYSEGMRVITTDQLRFMPEVKTTNYMPAIFAMREAQGKGFDDAIYLNEGRELLEGTTSNLFFFKEGKLITTQEEIVKGVTREIVLQLAKEHYPIELRPLHFEELPRCDEAFLTSSRKGMVPLIQIEEQTIGNGRPGLQTTHLRDLFVSYQNHYFSEYLQKN